MPQHPLIASQIEHVNRTDIAALVGDDSVDTVVNEFICVLEKAVQGWQSSLQQQDWHALRLISHRLKSAAGFVGLNHLAAELNQFEQAVSSEIDVFDPVFAGENLRQHMQSQLNQLMNESSQLKHQRK